MRSGSDGSYNGVTIPETRVSAHETYGGYGQISVLCRILSGVDPSPYTAIGLHTLTSRVDFNREDAGAKSVTLARQCMSLGNLVYVGLNGTSGAAEVKQDERRLTLAGKITRMIGYENVFVRGDQTTTPWKMAGHLEKHVIRDIGLANPRVLNTVNGGAGCPPKDQSVGGVFVMWCVKV